MLYNTFTLLIFLFLVVKRLLLNAFNKALIFIPGKIVQAQVKDLMMLFVDSCIVFFYVLYIAFIGIQYIVFFVCLLAVYFRCLLMNGKVLAIYCS